MSERELLVSVGKKDLTITYYKASGGGGQKRNKTMSGVRIYHADSGVMATNCDTPSQSKNKKAAFNALVKKPAFEMWLRKATAEAMMSVTQKEARAAAIEAAVDRSMKEENLKVEFYDPC